MMYLFIKVKFFCMVFFDIKMLKDILLFKKNKMELEREIFLMKIKNYKFVMILIFFDM